MKPRGRAPSATSTTVTLSKSKVGYARPRGVFKIAISNRKLSRNSSRFEFFCRSDDKGEIRIIHHLLWMRCEINFTGTSMRNRFNYRSNGPGFTPRPTHLPADTRWTRATVGEDHAVQLDRSIATSSVLARREEASGMARSYFKPAHPNSHFPPHTAGIPVLFFLNFGFFVCCVSHFKGWRLDRFMAAIFATAFIGDFMGRRKEMLLDRATPFDQFGPSSSKIPGLQCTN